jgi:hypothetical protein
MYLAASQRGSYCTSVNSHSSVGLVSRQWDAFDWACVPCDHHIHKDRASRSTNLHQYACPFYSSRLAFGGGHRITHVRQYPYSQDLATCDFWFFPNSKIAVKIEEICESDSHRMYKLSQRRLTAYWLAPQESDCLRMRSKFSFDKMPSYIKATRPVLEIIRMVGYFPGNLRIINTLFIVRLIAAK